MLSAYCDDSADEKQERVFCVAALVGRAEDWEAIEQHWVGALRGRQFHAKDCETDRGAFKATSHSENLALYAHLANLISESRLFGYSHAVDLDAVKSVFGDEMLWDSPFYFCLSRVLADCARIGYLSIPQQRVKLTLDCRRESAHNATRLYNGAKASKDWKYAPWLADELLFASGQTVGVQTADLLAREGMKALDRHIGVSRPLRGSLLTILRGRRFKFRMYGRAYLEQVKEQVRALDAPFSRADYRSWLDLNGVVDNHSNRIRWLWEVEHETNVRSKHDE